MADRNKDQYYIVISIAHIRSSENGCLLRFDRLQNQARQCFPFEKKTLSSVIWNNSILT